MEQKIKIKKEYRAAALDMDGTALNDRKELAPETRAAIHDALVSRKRSDFLYGPFLRGDGGYPAGISRHALPLRGERRPGFMICAPAAPTVSMVSMEKDLIRLLWEAIRGRDVMPQIFSRGASLGNADQLVRMAHYQMGVYQESFDRVCTPVKDVEAAALEEGRSVEKVNFYQHQPGGEGDHLPLSAGKRRPGRHGVFGDFFPGMLRPGD